MKMNLDGDYLIIAPKKPDGSGYYHSISERGFLVENILNFLENNDDIDSRDVTVCELRQINGEKP